MLDEGKGYASPIFEIQQVGQPVRTDEGLVTTIWIARQTLTGTIVREIERHQPASSKDAKLVTSETRKATYIGLEAESRAQELVSAYLSS